MAVSKKNTIPNTGGVQRAKEIANQSLTPVQQAQATVGKEVNLVSPVINPTGPFYPDIGATAWGPALHDNNAIRAASAGNNFNGEPPIKYYMVALPGGPRGLMVPQSRPFPNPAYTALVRAQEEARKQTVADREIKEVETQKTESIVATEIDKIIEESNEIVKEIENKQEPVREPVDPVQDIVRPPAPITPTELVLENQKACEDSEVLPSIVINNNNEVIVDLTASATSSAVAVPVITVEQPRVGCTDPDAINYDPEARIDDGSCVFEPVDEEDPVTPNEPPPPPPLEIPDTTPYVDSHGRTVFTIPKELVEITERTAEEGIITLKSGQPIVADLKLVRQVIRPASNDSDLIHTPVEKELADRLAARDELGELAGDSKLPAEEDIVIIGDREKIITAPTRNDKGIIILKKEDTSKKIKVSLRNNSFSFNQYQKTIDTEFKQLIGKI